MQQIATYANTRYDPTRTTVLRNAFARAMRRKFVELKRVIRIAIVDQDCFGTKNPMLTSFQVTPPGERAFAYMRDPAKVEAFAVWLERQVERGLLSIGEFQQSGVGIEGAWTNRYILDAYKRGVMRARYEMARAGMNVPTAVDVDLIMGMPMHLDRVGLLYTRVYSALQGITAQMDAQISEVLAQGMIDGVGMKELARKLVAVIDGTGAGTLGVTDVLGRFIPAERRALTLVRTEIVRAHHLGAIQEYKNWRVDNVYVLAEWVTAGDERVCPDCHSFEGKRYTLEEIEPMIPRHPNCRCIAMPYLAELEPYYTRR